MKGKWSRKDVQSFLASFSGYSIKYIAWKVRVEEKYDLYPIISMIAEHMSQSLKSQCLGLENIRYYTIIDGMSKKERIIGVQHPLHQMYDYVAIEGLSEMLDARIGVFQCASLPGKGQAYGKKHIEKWVREKDTIYHVKGDIRQCFPSISHDRLKELLRQTIKNDRLYWLTCELISMFDKGLSIGSYLSQYLCNFYLSFAYHYSCNELFKVRKSKRDGDKKVRLINHTLFYMDDFLLTGSNKKDLRKAMKMLIDYINNFLGLEVKPKWKISKLSENEPIDMMGFVFRVNRTTIREKIFLKTRRYFLKANRLLKLNKPIPLDLAYKCVSAFGWYKNTDSWTVKEKNNINHVVIECRKVVSYHAKLEGGTLDEFIAQYSST